MAGDHRLRFFFRQTNCQHRPFATGAFIHETRAQHDHPRGFFQWQNSSDTGRSDLADTVADYGGRLNAERFPKRHQTELHRENRRLGNFR